MSKNNSSAGFLGILVFALFWNGLVGVFDVVLVRQVVAERHARATFDEVPATILSSTVTSHTQSEGATTYKPEITFSYEVAGRTYSSERYAYSVWSSSDRDMAYDIVADYPVGSDTTARVDPEDPTEAVLDVSGRSFPALLVLFLVPFHCIGFWLLWAFVHGMWRSKWTADEVLRERYVLVDDAQRFVLQRPRTGAIHVFLGMLLITTFVAIFPLAFIFGMSGSSPYVTPVLAVCASAAATMAIRQRTKERTADNYLFVDRARRLFSYPADALGESLDTIERIAVRAVDVPDGATKDTSTVHVFEAYLSDKPHQVFKITATPKDAADILRLIETAMTEPNAGIEAHVGRRVQAA